jgi:enhancing lycopene biosynthesis protein 2
VLLNFCLLSTRAFLRIKTNQEEKIMAKVAVVLSGCGVYDGSEIYESVLTLLRLDQAGAEVQCFAPDMTQHEVINHLTGEVAANESRNVLMEAARICRGDIKPLSQANADDFDALIVPGGFGAAKNLSDFAVAGSELTVQSDLLRFGQQIHAQNKPIGLICIAPAMTAAIVGEGAICTIGNDQQTAQAITQTGATHQDCPVDQAVVDHQNKLVTTPAYMLANRISEAASGIFQAVDEVLAMAND